VHLKAVLLAGGLGTRLREETEYRPKPMVEIGQRPILWHIMKNLSRQEITEFVVCLGYKGDFIKDYFLNYEARVNDVTIALGSEPNLSKHSNSAEENWLVTLANTGLEYIEYKNMLMVSVSFVLMATAWLISIFLN
jgi:glucose-1-phosphate cytidylyltransferase